MREDKDQKNTDTFYSVIILTVKPILSNKSVSSRKKILAENQKILMNDNFIALLYNNSATFYYLPHIVIHAPLSNDDCPNLQ